MIKPATDKKVFLDYLKSHSKEAFFSKHYGSYMMPIFVQGYFAVARALKDFPFSMKCALSFQNFTVDREFDWLWSVEDMQKTRRYIFSHIEKDNNFGKKFFKKYYQGFKIFDKRAKIEERKNLEKYTAQELVKNLLEIIEAGGAQGMGYCVDSLLSFSDDDWFVEGVEKYAKQKLDKDTVEILRSPTHRSFVNSYALRLLEARCLQEKGKDISKSVAKIVKDYYWVENNYIKAQPKTAQQVEVEIAEIKDPINKYKEEKNRIEQNKKQKQLVYKKIKASPLLKAFVQFADDSTFIQDCRKQVVLRINHFNLNYLDRLADLLSVDRELAKYVMFYELKDFIKNPKPYLKIAQDRKAGCLSIFLKNKFTIFSRAELKGIDLSNFFPDLSSTNELKGMTACPGKVTGIAKVILGSDQFSIFEKGDILITNQTTPDFVPLMKKAGAVVAEQGGVTSHAAIVSRELGVPCIVGAKKAMSVFKTGDKVEVDASNGLIRKL